MRSFKPFPIITDFKLPYPSRALLDLKLNPCSMRDIKISLVSRHTSLDAREQAVPVPYEVHAVGGWHCLPLSNIILRQTNLDATLVLSQVLIDGAFGDPLARGFFSRKRIVSPLDPHKSFL
jgi:hypothetical protein